MADQSYEQAVQEFVQEFTKAVNSGFTPEFILAHIPNPRLALKQLAMYGMMN